MNGYKLIHRNSVLNGNNESLVQTHHLEQKKLVCSARVTQYSVTDQLIRLTNKRPQSPYPPALSQQSWLEPVSLLENAGAIWCSQQTHLHQTPESHQLHAEEGRSLEHKFNPVSPKDQIQPSTLPLYNADLTISEEHWEIF